MDSQNGVMTHQSSAIKVSPGRGILKQDAMGWRLNLVRWWWSPCHQGSSPGLAWVGTAQELAPQHWRGDGMGLEQTSTLTCSCEERWEILATKCGTVWNSQFVMAHSEFKNRPSLKGDFCNDILRKNRPLSSKNGQQGGLLLSEALIIWAHFPWLWH